jgi:dihydrofolate reductase
MISLIAAIDETYGLGFNNQLLCHLPADLQHFKSVTMGKPIVMGRKTFNSIGKPLPGRLNIILSRNASPIDGVVVSNSLDNAIQECKDFPEIMIIGGAELYAQSINQADRLYITRIHHRFTADVFFPEINDSIWQCQETQYRSKDEKNKFDMTFEMYQRIG